MWIYNFKGYSDKNYFVYCIHCANYHGAQKLQGSSANSPMPKPARALNPGAKPSRLPSSPDGPPSLLMPPSPPLPQACYARTHHPTRTWMASSHHVANSSPTCHESPLPPAEPQPPLKEYGLDLATPPPLAWRLTRKQSLRCLETDQYNSHFVAFAWRLPNTTVQDRDPAAKRCGKKNNYHGKGFVAWIAFALIETYLRNDKTGQWLNYSFCSESR